MSWDSEMKDRMGKEIAEGIAMKVAKGFALAFGMLFFFAIFGFLLAWLIQYLWNSTLAAMFEWPQISYWQAFGLLVLAKIFFGMGLGGGGHKDHWNNKKAKQEQLCRTSSPTDDTNSDYDANTKSEAFKKYWIEEGRSAYEAHVAANKSKETRSEKD